jgi:hypothetical protein
MTVNIWVPKRHLERIKKGLTQYIPSGSELEYVVKYSNVALGTSVDWIQVELSYDDYIKLTDRDLLISI